MYSRNYATFENVNTARLTSNNQRNISVKPNQTVPFKSFSDETAFERFNSLGKNNSHDETSHSLNNESEFERITESEEADETSKIDMYDEIVSIPLPNEIQADKKDSKSSMFSEIQKILKLIEGDWFIVILAISMLIFGSNETNDKLTPIALLAIMLI